MSFCIPAKSCSAFDFASSHSRSDTFELAMTTTSLDKDFPRTRLGATVALPEGHGLRLVLELKKGDVIAHVMWTVIP